jgi:FG-GAP-like repeat
VVVADFNQDGKPDIATVITGGNYSALFYGKGNGTFGTAVPIKGVSGEGIATGDFNHDGFPDLAVDVSDVGIAILINTQAVFP